MELSDNLHTVHVHGHRTAYVRHGDGPPVVLLHGYAGAMWMWEHQIEALGRHFTVFVPDVLGHGLSDKPRVPYNPALYLNWLTGFLDGLGLRRAHFVGNSMGCGLALGLALDHPERVDRLVLISGFPTDILTKIRGTYLERISHLRSRWLFAVGYHLLGRWAFRKYLGAVVCRRELITAAVVERAYRLRKDYGNSWPYWSSLQHISYWEEQFAPRLHAVRAPTLIVWGAQDRFFPLHAGEELQRALPNARWAVIQEAGHLPMWEKPEEVNWLIVEFLTPPVS